MPDYKPKIVVSSLEATSASSQVKEAGVYFPIFKNKWDPRYWRGYKLFSANLENPSLRAVPELEDVKASIEAYSSFCPKNVPLVPGPRDFWQEIIKSNPKTVYFLDKYFLIKKFERVFLFSNDIPVVNGVPAFKIMIITSAVSTKNITTDEFESDDKDENERYETNRDKLDGEIQKSIRMSRYKDLQNKVSYYILDKDSCDLIHDRFVVVDGLSENDCCFWHFGASAGGMAARLNAYSGPWPDKGRQFCKFIESLLPKDGDDDKAESGERSGYGNK